MLLLRYFIRCFAQTPLVLSRPSSGTHIDLCVPVSIISDFKHYESIMLEVLDYNLHQ